MTPTVSIIIAVKNAAQPLQETLDSIRVQQYPLEVVVIDGASTDDTLAVIQANRDIVTHFSSEPDEGISDAFNKGMRKATGEYINFQGAGDTLYSPDAIRTLFAGVTTPYPLVCGKIIRVTEDGLTPLWVAPKKIAPRFTPRTFLLKMALPHQGLFTHRTFFEQYGEFDKNIRFCMDYELLLRAYHQFPPTLVKDVIISRWREGGIGTNREMEVFDEYNAIKKRHHVAPKSVLWAIDKYIRAKFLCKKTLLSGG